MAKKYIIPFNTNYGKECLVEIYIEGATGDVIELKGSGNPFVVEQDRTNSSTALKGIIDTYYKIEFISTPEVTMASFDHEQYGDVWFKYYEDEALCHVGVISPFESGSPYEGDGYYAITLSGESGIKELKNKEFRNTNGAFLSGKMTVQTAIHLCMLQLFQPNAFQYESRVDISVFVDGTQVSTNEDFLAQYIDAETFKTGINTWMSCYEALETILAGNFDFVFDNKKWVIDYSRSYIQSERRITNYSASSFLSSNVVSVSPTPLDNSVILRNGSEGRFFSKKNIKINKEIKSVRNSITNGVFEAVGDDILGWTNENSFSSKTIGGYGTQDEPYYVKIDNSVYGTPAPPSSDTEWMESTPFTWNPFGTLPFADRNLVTTHDEDERLKISLDADFGTGIEGHRLQIKVKFQELNQIKTVPTQTGPFTAPTYTETTLWYTQEGWSTTEAFYVTGNNKVEEIEVPAPYVNSQQIFKYRALEVDRYYEEEPTEFEVRIRIYRGARKKIGESTAEEIGLGYSYFVKYYALGVAIWLAKDDNFIEGASYEYLTVKKPDRESGDTITSAIYNDVYPFAYGSLFHTSSSTTPINGFRKRGGSEILDWITYLAADYLRQNDSRLYRLDVTMIGNFNSTQVFTYNGKILRVYDYEYNVKTNQHKFSLIEVKDSGSDIIQRTDEGDYKVVTTSKPLNVITDYNADQNIYKEGNTFKLSDFLKDLVKIKGKNGLLSVGNSMSVDEYFYLIAEDGGSIRDVSESTGDDWTLIKPAENGTYATREWVNKFYWGTEGNTLTVEKKLGTLNDFDLPFVRNNVEIIKLLSTGLKLSVLTNETTDVDKFLVSNNGLVKYRTGTQILSDIGALATPIGLTTNYVPKWNGTTFVNSQIFDNGTNVGIGTASPLAKLHVLGNAWIRQSDSSYLRFTSNTTSANINFNNTFALSFAFNDGIDLFRITSTGRVGINNTSPAYGLDVNGTGHFTDTVTFDKVPTSAEDATLSNHLVRYSQLLATTSIKYLPTPVKTVSLGNITLSGEQTISAYPAVSGDRVLVIGQTDQKQNGIYVVGTGAWTRATDSDTDTEIRGYIVNVNAGTYSGYKYINTNSSTITIGTTNITYSEFSNSTESDPVFNSWKDTVRTANYVYAAPNGSNGVASFRSLVSADIPDLSWAKITSGTPTTLSGYGITDAYTKTESDSNYVSLVGSYSNPTWITSLDYSKLSSVPTTFAPSAHTIGSHSDVNFGTLANDNIIKYDLATGKWVNGIEYSYTHPTYDDYSSSISITTSTIAAISSIGMDTLGHITNIELTILPFASSTQVGVLKSVDWNRFNNKQDTIFPKALTRVNDTNVTLTLGGDPDNALLQNVSLTLGWSGLLGINRGGTGLGALGSANQMLRVNSGATALEYFTPTFISGNQSITWTGSGDVTGTASGTTSITPTLTLATITQGTGSIFGKFSLDTKGRVIGNTAVVKADLTTLLGTTQYLPYNTGTTNYLTKWSNTTGGLVNSQIFDNGTNIGFGTNTPTQKVDIIGNLRTYGNFVISNDYGTRTFSIDTSGRFNLNGDTITSGSTSWIFGGNSYVGSGFTGTSYGLYTQSIAIGSASPVSLYGAMGRAYQQGSGNIGTMASIVGETYVFTSNATGEISNSYSIFAPNITYGGGATSTIITSVGVSILDRGQGTDRYAILHTGTDKSSIGGALGIGITSPLEKLHVVGSIRQSGVTSSLIKADANGKLVAAVAGTDYLTSLPSHTLDSHSNVTITSNTAGEILKWNGSAWINNTLAEAGISAVGHTHTTADITNLSSYTGLDSRYYTETEVNNLFTAFSPALTNTQIGFGNGSNQLSGSSSLTWSSNQIHITGGTGNFNIGKGGADAEYWVDAASTNLNLYGINIVAKNTLQLNVGLRAGGSLGTSGQVLSSTGSGVQWITPSSGVPTLTNQYIGFGNGSNLLSGSSNFLFDSDRILRIKNGAISNVELARISGENNYGLFANGGYLNLYSSTNDVRVNSLVGSGTRMVVANSNGTLSTQTIPSGGSATLNSTQIGFGNGSNILSGSANFTYIQDRVLTIKRNTDSYLFAFGYNFGLTEAVITSENGSGGYGVGMAIYAPSLKIAHLGGSGSQMVTVDNNGTLGKQAIPSGGGGSQDLDSVLSVGKISYAKGFDLRGYCPIEFKNASGVLKAVTELYGTNDLYTWLVSGSKWAVGSNSIVFGSGSIASIADETENITLNGTNINFGLSNAFGSAFGSYSTGAMFLMRYDGTRFIPMRVQEINSGGTYYLARY